MPRSDRRLFSLAESLQERASPGDQHWHCEMISAKFYPWSSHDGIATEDVCTRDGPLWCHPTGLALRLRLSLTARRKAQVLSLRKELCLLASQAYDVQDVVQLSILLRPWKAWNQDLSPPAWAGTVYSTNQKNVNTEEAPRPPDPCWPRWRRTPQTYTQTKFCLELTNYFALENTHKRLDTQNK